MAEIAVAARLRSGTSRLRSHAQPAEIQRPTRSTLYPQHLFWRGLIRCFDYRYHALSLAAVLLALAVGVLIGVAIGDSNLVSSAKSGVVHDLRSEVSGANNQADHLRSRLANEEALGNDLYQITVHGLLSGRRVGLVFLGTLLMKLTGWYVTL